MYFVIRKNPQGKYWWRSVADGNNEILAASELLENKAECFQAIEIVKLEASQAPTYDKTIEVSHRDSV
jgi:uncharacterized protein YegP (UPF0339 family)